LPGYGKVLGTEKINFLNPLQSGKIRYIIFSCLWRHRLSVRTPAFHAGKAGSIPAGAISHNARKSVRPVPGAFVFLHPIFLPSFLGAGRLLLLPLIVNFSARANSLHHSGTDPFLQVKVDS
jgi:hypothetical protein